MTVVTSSTAEAGAVDGDAGSYLDELIAGDGAAPETPNAATPAAAVEIVGPHLRLAGGITLGRFRRLSDVLNHHDGPLLVSDATILRRNGTATRVRTPTIWLNLGEVTLVGVPLAAAQPPPSTDLRIPKESRALVVVTPGHTLTGDVYVPVGGELARFVESTDPAFIPMTDVRTRSLADRRVVARYDFALINRRHIVAATEAPSGMLGRRNVL
jgi:hypothetical protein